MSRRGLAVFVVGVLAACGDPAVQGDAGVGSDAAASDGPPIAVDAPIDAPIDAPADAPPRCGDNHVDPGEQCDGVEGLSGDGCSATCTPETTIAWTNLTPNPAPSRFQTAVAYDSVRHRLVLFGGSDDDTDTNETWEYDGTTWVERLTLVSPPARHGHAMVYDSARQRVVMFGGGTSSAGFGDTWEWDGTTWVQRMSTTSPLPDSSPRMAYDPARQVTVMWLGLDTTWEWDGTNWAAKNAPIPQCCGGGIVLMTYGGADGVMLIGGNAQWTWDGTSWTRHAFQETMPWAQSASWAVYDSTLGRPLLIREMLEVWAWSNGTWVKQHSQLNITFPLAVAGAAAYDPDRGVTIFLAGPFGPVRAGNVWEWNGTSWRQRYGSVPPPRGMSAFAYDARRGRLVMFGGDRTNDIWEWDGTTWHLRPTTSPAPTPRWAAAATYDERRGRVVVHGGYPAVIGASTDDTWEWDGFNWRPVMSDPRPAPRVTMAFDRAHGYVLAVEAISGDTWKYDGSTWTKLTPALTAHGAQIAYDAHRGIVVLLTSVMDAMGNSVMQVWEWTGTNWIVKGAAPTNAAAFYDPVRARVIAHDSQFPMEQFWSWDGATWTNDITTHRPIEPNTIFDPTSGSWFSFGTETGWDTWLARSFTTRDACDGTDVDGDNLRRCADPDCWWRCTPLCAPGELHCDPFAPHCGDSVCSSLEVSVCPADCP